MSGGVGGARVLPRVGRARSLAATASVAAALLCVGLTAGAARPSARPAAPTAPPSGRVFDTDGRPVQQAMVTARAVGGAMAVTAYTDHRGRYVLPADLAPGTYDVEVRHWFFGLDHREGLVYDGGPATWDFTLFGQVWRYGPSSSFLNQLPDGPEKRRFILDCTGCHVFNERLAFPAGEARSGPGWAESIRLMVARYGPGSGFPIISGYALPERWAPWLVRALRTFPAEWKAPTAYSERDLSRAVLTEYDLPEPDDLPHDLMVGRDGRVVITGMLTDRMYLLDPETGDFETVDIPVRGANPRALDMERDGSWWVALGAPGALAHYDPRREEWQTYDIGMYPHSIMLDRRGRVWYNGHFTVGPELIGRIDPRRGDVRQYPVPPVARALRGESNIPYGLRVDRWGTVWMTELRGNHLVRLEPEQGLVDLWPMPEPESGPRRLDVGPDGVVWIPEYAAGGLVRFDPDREAFTRYALPIEDALPYVVRVDARSNVVWIGTAAADAVLSFDPADEQFTVYPLPTRGALIRHLDIDPSSGDVWASYSASPGIPAKILRIRFR